MAPPTAPGQSGAGAAARTLIALAVGLTSFGLVMVYSTSSALRAKTGHDLSEGLARQGAWALVAVLGGVIAARVSLERLRRLALPVLLVSVALLVATLVLGPEVNGSRRWLRLGQFSFQPSEAFKIAVLIFLADRLARGEIDACRFRLRSIAFLPAAGVALVLVEPDLGTAIFLLAEAVVLVSLAGASARALLPYVAAGLPVACLYAYVRFDHVRERLAFYARPEGGNGQVRQALVALGSGGLFGVGLGEGTQKMHYLPEAHTDFIFAVIGEELGFLGCAAVVLAFMTFVVQGQRVAWAARARGPDSFGFLVASGATFIVAFQALINIAVVTATVPTKGVSLPFISLGGSNLLLCGLCVGLLVNVATPSRPGAGRKPRRCT